MAHHKEIVREHVPMNNAAAYNTSASGKSYAAVKPGISPVMQQKIVQKTPAQDVDHAKTNAKHLRDEVFPGTFDDFRTVYRGVRAQINAYSLAHGGANPPGNSQLEKSADGLRQFSQNLVEAADAKWAEAGEMARLLNKGHIPIPARNTGTDADIEYRKNGIYTGVEVKACNTHVVGDVTQHINTADTQLGTRPNIGRGKITMWIAHESNRWPGVVGFNNRTTNAAVQVAVQNQLNGMALPSTNVVRLLMVRVPGGHPSPGGAVDVLATGGNGAWVANVYHVH